MNSVSVRGMSYYEERKNASVTSGQNSLLRYWSSGNVFVSGAGGLSFKSRAGQIGHSVANGSPLLQHFF